MAAKGLVTVFGGSGFIGQYTAQALVTAGYRVRVACRRPHLAGDVRMAGAPGWVDIVQANIRDRASCDRAVEGADAVINLVGILYESGKQSFDGSQAAGAKNVAEAAAAAGITRMVQVSAIGADADSKANYARTKAEAEAAVREVLPSAVILRPSIVFGPEDDFFNRFADMAKNGPALPAIGGGHTMMQPVFAGDVADAIVKAVIDEELAGQTFELGGPRTYSMNELYDFILETIDRKRFKASLPFFIAKPMGLMLGAIYKVPLINLGAAIFFRIFPPTSGGKFLAPPLTGDQVEMLKTDNVVAEGAAGFK
ncbi:MAG: complex I NDUFA9 subunit family protein, partial [Pseudomonadota bacterium]